MNVGSTVVLAGPPGAGKTTVARAFAAEAVDLDEVVAHVAGRSPAELIREHGEAALREAECRALESLSPETPVLALGGGTLTTPRGRSLSRARGPVVLLDASPDTVAARLRREPGDRPLLTDLAVSDLMNARQRSYAAVDARVDASPSPGEVAEHVRARAADTRVINVPLGGVTTRVLLGRDIALTAMRGAVASLAPSRPTVVVVDRGAPQAASLAASLEAAEPCVRIEVEGGEACKTWPILGDLLERAIAGGAGRQSVVVGIGGGAVCDLAGLAAALLGRGVPLVLVPTTVLAQADASVGGKCAVDVGLAKNLVGAFHPASEVIIDLALTDTQAERDRSAGLAEVVKAGVLGDADLFEAIARTGSVDAARMFRAICVKAHIVTRDPREQDVRKFLNLGHTLGHALESASGMTLRHGEAVAMGLAAAARMSVARGLTSPDTAMRIETALTRCGLPTQAPAELLASAGPHLLNDKKGNRDTVELVLIRGIGDPCLIELPWTDAATELLRAGGGA